ncbi:MAG: transcription elongation factor GreA [Mycoplasmataceae bacterium]|jgi:transcription elongation factor GreA|nr:transcription elongation factor GreA [Mycoplasmataceae bacterium]
MENNEILLSKEKIDALEKELKQLIDVKRPAIIKLLQDARLQGDLSENADYDAAKEEQSTIEARINQIQTFLRNKKIIKDAKSNNSTISIGKFVTYVKSGKEYTFQIVGEIEANPDENKISNICPLARALLGKSVGDIVKVIGIIKPYTIEVKKIS